MTEAPRSLPILPVAVAALAAGALFRIWPALDLAIAGWFHADATGFTGRDSLFVWAMYRLSPIVLWGLALSGVAFALFAIVNPARIKVRHWRLALTLLIGLALGPGLLINMVFKDNWGRARPAQVTEFGGDLKFTPPLMKADQCGRNCSFPAGHPSVLFLGFAFAAGVAGRRRRRIVVGAAALGGLSGLGRMMQGSHFLSDVLFSGFITYGAVWLAWHLSGSIPAMRTAGRTAGHLAARTLAATAGALAWAVDQAFRIRIGRVQFGMALAASAIAVGIGGFDKTLAARLAPAATDKWVSEWSFVSAVSRPLYWVTALILLFAAVLLVPRLRPGKRAASAIKALTVAAAGAYASTGVLKFLIGRSRPPLWFADGTSAWGPFGWSHDWWSFPSSHTAAATAVALVAGRITPHLRFFYLAIVSLVALSRLMLSAHWFSDIVAGAAVGAVTAACVHHFMKEPGVHGR